MFPLYKYVLALALAGVFSATLYSRSSMPPYGYPINELSNNYWGVIVDVAHRWRALDFTAWTRSLGGGYDLFSSGQYPVLHPTNALAWFLSDDVFYLVKLIEPYFWGFFFMMVLLWDVFKTRWYVAVFGGLAYMGMLFSKQTTLVESPYFLMGCALFPAMVLAFIKAGVRHAGWAAAAVGAVIGFQFLSEGVTQLPQLILWWTIFFMCYGEKRLLCVGFCLLSFLAVSAIQLLPTLQFFLHESARTAGQYGVNNYPLWGNGINSTGYHLYNLLTGTDPLKEKMSIPLILTCAAVAVLHAGRVFAQVPHRKFVITALWATAGYFFMPTGIDVITHVWPFTEKIFGWLTFFSIRYGLHILDFCLILWMSLIITHDRLSFERREKSTVRLALASILGIAALAVGLLPLMLFLFPGIPESLRGWPWLTHYVPVKLQTGIMFAVTASAFLWCVLYRPASMVRHGVLIYLLFSSAYPWFLDSFKWYDKGCRVQAEAFQLDSPERKYYVHAKGKYLLPYVTAHAPQIQSNALPEWTAHNYNLLYGVSGTSGFMALAPRRLIQFQAYYNNRNSEGPVKIKSGGAFFLNIYEPTPASFTTYFPADFTMVRKDQALPWPGFNKVVAGERFDVYERDKPAPRVYFGDNIQVKPLRQLVKEFDRPRTTTVYVEEEDSKDFDLPRGTWNIQGAEYWDFKTDSDARLSFMVKNTAPVIVVVPERYQRGWQVRVDGIKTTTFPAHYLFIGFSLSPGRHTVEMVYHPAWH